MPGGWPWDFFHQQYQQLPGSSLSPLPPLRCPTTTLVIVPNFTKHQDLCGLMTSDIIMIMDIIPILGWLNDLLERLSDLQLGDEKGTLNHHDHHHHRLLAELVGWVGLSGLVELYFFLLYLYRRESILAKKHEILLRKLFVLKVVFFFSGHIYNSHGLMKQKQKNIIL